MAPAGTIWITGVSGSGKTSLARALVRALNDGTGPVVLVDGDEFRGRLERTYGHTLEERFAVLRLMVDAVRAENLQGRTVVVAAISHKRAMRVHAREQIHRFMEVFLDCPTEVCAARDPKGLYARAKSGEYPCFPGITEPYEPSASPERVLDTAALSTEAALGELLPDVLGFLSRGS